MKKSISFLFLIFSFFLGASAENILVMTNPKSKETNVFRKGSYVVFQLKADQSMHEGFIRDINDSSLVLDYSQVSLSQITIFAGSTKSKVIAGQVAHAVGNSLLFVGTTVFNCGTDIFLYSDYYYWPIGGTVWLAGACLAGIGHMFDWALGSSWERSIRVRDYRNWDAAIISDSQYSENQVVQQRDTNQTIQPDPIKKEKRKKGKYLEDDVYGN